MQPVDKFATNNDTATEYWKFFEIEMRNCVKVEARTNNVAREKSFASSATLQ